MESAYRQEPLGEGRVRFTVTPASVPNASMGPNWTAAILAVVVFFVLLGRGNAFTFVLASVAAVLTFRFVKGFMQGRFDRSVDKQRSPGGAFVAGPGGLEPGLGPKIDRGAIHRLLLRNGIPQPTSAGVTMVVDSTSVSQGIAADAQIAREANRAKAASVSYMLCVESGGRSTTLAGGMTETTAYGLLQDVQRTLGIAAAV